MPKCDGKAALVLRPVNGTGTSTEAVISQVTIASPTGSCQGSEETAWVITDYTNNFSKLIWAECNLFSP
jgi:hypothetical protein